MEKFNVVEVLGYKAPSSSAEYLRAYQRWKYRNDETYRKKKNEAGRVAYLERTKDKIKRVKRTEEDKRRLRIEYQKEYNNRPGVKEKKNERQRKRYREDDEYRKMMIDRANEYHAKKRSKME